MDFGIAKFRIAKFSHCEIDIAKFSHCEFSHCEIFALRIWYCENFRIAKLHLALRNLNLALRIWHLALRNAQWPAATVPLLLNPAASHPVSTASHFLHFSFDFPLILGLVDG